MLCISGVVCFYMTLNPHISYWFVARRRAKPISTRRAKDCDYGCMFHTAPSITIRDQRSNNEFCTSSNRLSVKYAG
ncbi:MAG: hypothetical protein DVB29_04330 [Verrucomicrobia bacterium]|nr:MAG: hypothetical protein DVB29_04330 [Verrucomicrobiota bacterium]